MEHGVNGFLFNPQNAESLAENIRRFLSMPERWAEMGQASLQRARPHQLQHTIKRYVEWYESVLGPIADGADRDGPAANKRRLIGG